jgi:ABC-type sugar transport system substrate-binding protein
MGNRRRLLVALTAGGLLFAAAGCSSSGGSGAQTSGAGAGSGDAGNGSVKIGFITKFPVDFYDTMVDAVKTWNKDHSDVTVLYAQGKDGTDDESEITAIQSMVTQGVNAIAITPTSPNVKGELQKAVDKGIKVVLIDNDIPGWTGKSSLVATNNLAGGVLAGKWLAAHLAAGAKLAVLQGVLGNPSLDDRVTGMLQGLGDHASVVTKLPTDCDQTKGLNAAQDILTAHPDVTAIYGACGPPIVGALQAVKAAGKTGKITLMGFDAAPDEVTAIQAGTEAASVAQFPAKMGAMGAQAALDAAQGKTPPPNIDTGTEIVTKDNASQFG